MKVYNYKDKEMKDHKIELPVEQENIVLQSQKDYKTSFSYIRKNYYDIWRSAVKSYELSTADRKAAL